MLGPLTPNTEFSSSLRSPPIPPAPQCPVKHQVLTSIACAFNITLSEPKPPETNLEECALSLSLLPPSLMCVHVYLCEYACGSCTHVCAALPRMLRGHRRLSHVFFCHSPPYDFKTRFLTKLGAILESSKPQWSFCLVPHSAGLKGTHTGHTQLFT